MFAVQEIKTKVLHTHCQKVLVETPMERQAAFSPLLQKYSKFLRPRLSSSPMPKDPQGRANPEPVYQKQGKIPQAHLPVVEETLQQWIRLRLIQRADSLFNAPLFCLCHNNGYRVAQDFRLLNKTLPQEPIKLKEIQETQAKVELEKPEVFSTLDFLDLAWQMTLNQEQATTMAFTLPRLGQFQWTRTPLESWVLKFPFTPCCPHCSVTYRESWSTSTDW